MNFRYVLIRKHDMWESRTLSVTRNTGWWRATGAVC